MKGIKELIKVAEITNGRIDRRQVFNDFVGLLAYFLSNNFDPVHKMLRTEQAANVEKQYSETELVQMREYMGVFASMVQENHSKGRFENILVEASLELGIMGSSEEPTPMDISRLLAELTFSGDLSDAESKAYKEMQEKGYITVMDSAAGGGSLILGAIEVINNAGINYYEKVACLAVERKMELARQCYVHLSMYGVPAVIIHGDSITVEEYARWYTPAYILGNWIWKCPLGMTSNRNKSDEILKMSQEPMYRIMRNAQHLFNNQE